MVRERREEGESESQTEGQKDGKREIKRGRETAQLTQRDQGWGGEPTCPVLAAFPIFRAFCRTAWLARCYKAAKLFVVR